MIRSSRSAVALGVGAVGWTLVLTAAAAQSPEARPSIAALQMDRPITLDGVLDESIWGEAEIGSDFTRREPEDRVPASERTEFSVLYTRDTLYFGIRAYDSNADGIIAKEMERDSRLDGDDSIAIVLDTFRDRRNAYVFEINLNGARKDLLVTDEGSNLNVEWNGVWSVATRRGEAGWTAEIAIPFSTLRFDRSLDAWGLNVRRLIRRKNEEVNWAALGREIYSDPFFAVYAAYRVSLAGELTGLEALRPSRQFDVKPFFVGTATEAPADLLGKVQTDADAGVDIKWGVTRSLALDLTYNTDFAEVEVDEQQINLTRFSLFFPEKREFFLENAGIFDFGAPQRENFDPSLLKVFFSRHFRMATTVGLNDVELPAGDFTTRLYSQRFDVSFSPTCGSTPWCSTTMPMTSSVSTFASIGPIAPTRTFSWFTTTTGMRWVSARAPRGSSS